MLQLFVQRRRAMYVKPEVTRYSGTELLDLMGPVETAYICGLDGPDVHSCETIEFTLYAPEGTSSFDWEGYNWTLIGPDGCDPVETSGWCGPNEENCPWELTDEDKTAAVFTGNLCDILVCNDECGDWTLEVELFDGETSEPCSKTLYGGLEPTGAQCPTPND
jgi:hypothetical protein